MKFIKWLRPAPPADPTAAPPAQERSESLRIADEDEAMVRAAASSGVHFSFEKVDRVTRSTNHHLRPL